MKKITILLAISILFFSCSNLENDTQLSLKLKIYENSSSRELSDPIGTIDSIEIWVSDVGEDFLLDENLVEFGQVSDDVLQATLEETSIRYLKFDNYDNNDSAEFHVLINIERVFTARVVFSSGRTFIGTDTRIIYPQVPSLELMIAETSISKQTKIWSDIAELFDEN